MLCWRSQEIHNLYADSYNPLWKYPSARASGTDQGTGKPETGPENLPTSLGLSTNEAHVHSSVSDGDFACWGSHNLHQHDDPRVFPRNPKNHTFPNSASHGFEPHVSRMGGAAPLSAAAAAVQAARGELEASELERRAGALSGLGRQQGANSQVPRVTSWLSGSRVILLVSWGKPVMGRDPPTAPP